MHKALCDAIADKLVVTFTYKGKQRTAEPHAVGNDKSGDLVLSAWQTSGGSGLGFRDFFVGEMSRVQTTGERFERARPGYNPNDSTLSRIICRL